jgi:rhodanese-related sulfurtransferase
MDTATPKHALTPADCARTLTAAEPPIFLDVRKAGAFAESDYFLPQSQRWDYHETPALPANLTKSRPIIAYCVKGAEVGISAAAQLNVAGFSAHFMEGGLKAWQEQGLLAVRKRPDLGVDGERISKWVTRERPKIDRIACPWLVKRFIDPRAEFHYVPTAQVFEFAKKENAVAYDIPGAPLEHNGALCSFDALITAFELGADPALQKLATIVRGADTDTLSLAPQSAGLLAISLGLSQNFADDHAMLAQGLVIYDALYRWCVSETTGAGEIHNWVPK